MCVVMDLTGPQAYCLAGLLEGRRQFLARAAIVAQHAAHRTPP